MLTIEILQMELPFGRLQELTVEWFAKQSLAPLDPTPLEHLLRSSIYTFETKLFRSIASLLNAKTKASIDTLLMIEDLNVTKIVLLRTILTSKTPSFVLHPSKPTPDESAWINVYR